MKKLLVKSLVFFSLCFFVVAGKSQTVFVPENLGEVVNSKYSEINPVVSTDGTTLFFNRVNHPENKLGEHNSMDIWYSELLPDSTYTEPQRLPESVNIARYNAFFAALDDGKSYLMLGHYNKAGTRWLTRGFSIIEHLGGDEWGIPQQIDVKRFSRMNRGELVSAHMSADRELLFMAFSRSANSERLSLYVSKKIDHNDYSKPEPLSFENLITRRVNSFEAPFITKDKTRLYFSANLDDNPERMNIYYAQRNDDDSFVNWSEPVKVTDNINTANWESYFTLNANESWAYYSSTTNSFGMADLFKVRMYEEFPYLRMRGIIANQADQTPMLADTTYTILVNGEEDFPGLEINKEDATYEVLLPLGRSYTLLPKMENWNGVSLVVDLTDVHTYTERRQNLYFTTVPFVQITGRIVDMRTGLQVPATREPKVLINGEASDDIVYDEFSSAFQVSLPLGTSYIFEAEIDNYEAVPKAVDVIDEKTFVEKDITLFVRSVNYVQLRGQVLDNVSMRPISHEHNPQFIIDGQIADTVKINPENSSFSVRLPFGKSYVLGVSADNYKTIDNVVDLTPYVEYAEVWQNIFAEHEDANIVFLSGQIINTKTENPLDRIHEVKLMVNDVVHPSFEYDPQTASYRLNLEAGINYDVLSRVPNFYNRLEQVDLTDVAPLTRVVRNIYVTPIEVGMSVDIEHIYFEFGSSRLLPESFRSLRAIIAFLNEYPNVRIEIGGHTDNVGSQEVNQRLSEERAKAVKDYIISEGIPVHRVESQGYSFNKPKASNRTAEGRAQNRRVDFTIIGI